MADKENQGFSWKSLTEAGRAIGLAALVLSLFLAVLVVKEWKSLAYVGRDIPIQNTITVNGKGDVFQAPDVATFSFTVEDTEKTVTAAQDKVNASTKAILAFLSDNGIADKDVQTESYSINPHYDYQNAVCPAVGVYNGSIATPVYCPPGKSTLTGYDVSESIQVKVRTLADAGKIVSGVGSLGATGVSGLAFTVDDDTAVTDKARTLAIADAKQRADALARELGVTLVRVASFSDSSMYPQVYYAKTMAAGMGASDSNAASLPSGENKYTSNVTVTYEIR